MAFALDAPAGRTKLTSGRASSTRPNNFLKIHKDKFNNLDDKPKKNQEIQEGNCHKIGSIGLLNEEFVRLHTRPLTHFFERRVRDTQDVPDLVQDVFLRICALPDPSRVKKLENYLFVTAANALRDKIRRDKARRRALHEELDECAHAGRSITPLRILESQEAINHLYSALLQLPKRSRDIFILRTFEECRMVDIADGIGVSRRAAEKHYARALAHVIGTLEEWRVF
jgi:RNA polymerase sigma factor (sigma-70 family)